MITLWLAVTNDKYELPIAVEDTARQLGLRLGITEHAVSMALHNEARLAKKRAEGRCKYKTKILSERKIIKLQVESLEDD